jgi:hypothetical protein
VLNERAAAWRMEVNWRARWGAGGRAV